MPNPEAEITADDYRKVLEFILKMWYLWGAPRGISGAPAATGTSASTFTITWRGSSPKSVKELSKAETFEDVGDISGLLENSQKLLEDGSGK